MAARIRMRDSGGTLRTIDGSGSSRIRMRDAGGTLRTITRVRARDASNTLRVVYDPSGASSFTATPSNGTRFGHSSGTGTVTTNSVTVTASGGTAPYTYAWTLISHDHPSVLPTANSPTSATTTFTQTGVGIAEGYTAVFRCTVTDSLLATATCDVTANFQDVT